MRDGSLESSLDQNFQESNYVTDYKLFPPQIIKCNLCENFKANLIPRGRHEMMEHMEDAHGLTMKQAIMQTARIPTMPVKDLDVL